MTAARHRGPTDPTDTTDTSDRFDRLLAATGPSHLLADDGTLVAIDPPRWRAPADPDDAWLLDRCTGPTLDLGCGPGRLVAALRQRGIRALGVDSSARANRMCRTRRIPMMLGDLFGPLPDEGRWAHVLLADGNIGIGGAPDRLLTRARTLLTPGGSVLLELDTDEQADWTGTVRPHGVPGAPAIRWARVGWNRLTRLAAVSGLIPATWSKQGHRAFAELVRPIVLPASEPSAPQPRQRRCESSSAPRG